MHSYYLFQSVYSLFYTAAIVVIAVLNYGMVLEARRKGLTAFLHWLVPATLGATASLTACVIRNLGPSFGFRPRVFFFLGELGLGALAAVLGVVTAARLWKMIKNWPTEAGAAYPRSGPPAEHQEGVWPPPPTGRA
jgi:hypothetical protein